MLSDGMIVWTLKASRLKKVLSLIVLPGLTCVSLTACLEVNTSETPPTSEETTLITTPEPVINPSNAAPTFEGSETDAFGLQANPEELNDDPNLQAPFNTTTNPLNVFHDASKPFEPFFLIRDVNNPSNPNAGTSTEATATWTFNIQGFTDLNLAIDIAAKGDFETEDTFLLTYQVDSSSEQEGIIIQVDEAKQQSYQLFNGVPADTLFDPLEITDDTGTKVATNIFQTFTKAIPETGDTLTLRLAVKQDGSSEMLAIKNIKLSGSSTMSIKQIP